MSFSKKPVENTRRRKVNKNDPKQPIRSQKPDPLLDRKALDGIIFDILGLTQAERDEVYLAVCELVKNRLEKAKSA